MDLGSRIIEHIIVQDSLQEIVRMSKEGASEENSRRTRSSRVSNATKSTCETEVIKQGRKKVKARRGKNRIENSQPLQEKSTNHALNVKPRRKSKRGSNVVGALSTDDKKKDLRTTPEKMKPRAGMLIEVDDFQELSFGYPT